MNNLLDNSFRFIRIPMLWVYGQYKYVYSYSAGIDCSRQNLTSTDVSFLTTKFDPHTVRVKEWMKMGFPDEGLTTDMHGDLYEHFFLIEITWYSVFLLSVVCVYRDCWWPQWGPLRPSWQTRRRLGINMDLIFWMSTHLTARNHTHHLSQELFQILW